VIRQAISCDICGSEKKQTNHWFVAYEQAGELRLAGWNSKNRLRANARHLCGQTCLHKLIDDFMARDREMDGRAQQAAVAGVEAEKPARYPNETCDTSLIADVAYDIEAESSARLIPTPTVRAIPAAISATSVKPLRAPVEMLPAVRAHLPESLPEEAPRFSSRNWRAEAWEREREREQHSIPRHSGIAARRRSNG